MDKEENVEIGKIYAHLNVCEDFTCLTECDIGVSEATKIYRYIAEETYINLVETGVNKLAHITKWEDPFEAFMIKGSAGVKCHNQLKGYFGQCWTLYADESDVRWRANGARGKVVRIESTVGELTRSLRSLPFSVAQHCYVGRVGYVEDAKLKEMMNDDTFENVNELFLSSMFVKRKGFREEREFRVILNLVDDDKNLVEVRDGLLHVPSISFIKGALFDPCMDERRVDEIQCRTIFAGMEITSKKSGLFGLPEITRKAFGDEVRFDNSYAEFWKEFVNSCTEMANRKHPTRHWWCYDTRKGAAFNYVVTHKYARVELYIDSGNYEQNVSVYESLKKHENEMRQQIGSNIEFEALEKKRAKRVKVELTGIDMTNQTNWPRAIKFMTETMPKFVAVIDKYLPNGRAN